MSDDLLSLTLALRAALEDAAGRGVIDEVQGELPAPVSAPAPAPAPPPVAAPSGASAWSAIARSARDDGEPASVALHRVREELGDCRRCGLCRERTQIVFGVGDPAASLVVVGEAPGAQEDAAGEPFVGPAGQMLDRMLANVLGLPRERVYILNVVKCRPPQNRAPLPDEVEACRPFLEAQLRAIRPKVILVLGAVAYRALLRADGGIGRGRGRWHDLDGVPVMPTFHPAYLLRTPEDKKLTFDDLKALKAKMASLGLLPAP